MAIIYGTRISITGAFTDSVGTPLDPSAVVFTLMKPDGTQQSYTFGATADIVRTGVGQYRFDLKPDFMGQAKFRWTSRATGEESVAESTFTVIPGDVLPQT